MNEKMDIFLPYHVWVELDEETDEERIYNCPSFEEAETYFKHLRKNAKGKVALRKTDFDGNKHETIATYYPY
jgi:hypothetical protein